jgi:hypothetical protein
MKYTDPVMDVKLKSKTHLLNMFFLFFEPFFAHLASKFEKSANMTLKKFFFEKNQERYQKTQNFTPISNPLKKFQKNEHEKSYTANKSHEHK